MSSNFFNPNGDSMADAEAFIKYYNNCYFIGCGEKIPYKTDKGQKRSVGQNSCYAEKLVENILKKGFKKFTDSDVALLLAWKIGKIKHSQSQKKKELVLHEDWQNVLGAYSPETLKFDKWNGDPIKRYGDNSSVVIDVKTIAAYLRSHGERLNGLVGSGQRQKAIDELNEQQWSGIGSVYLITLLYFVSNYQHPGACPIYDRFAMRALLAIKDNKAIGDSVECGELPDKNSKRFSKSIDKRMNDYIYLLKCVFGSEYKYNRDIDRALWVYGHLFKDSAKGKVISIDL